MPVKHPLLFVLIFLLLNSTLIYAEKNNEEKWYSVEYIVFENTLTVGDAAEPWTKSALEVPFNAINLNSSQNNAFAALNSSERQLHAVASKLKRLSAYTPIAHGGWTQKLQANTPLQPVQVIQQYGTNQLNGTITFHSKKYLHLDINLQLTELDSSTNYRLKATRRIKADDIHYFDHPRFAVLAHVKKQD